MHQLLEDFELGTVSRGIVTRDSGTSEMSPGVVTAWRGSVGGAARSELRQVKRQARRRLGCSGQGLGASASQNSDIGPREKFEAPV
jgi:hypothetical protein